MTTLDAYVPEPAGLRPVRIAFGSEIARIETTGAVTHDPTDERPVLVPGFVDVHVHGGGGADAMDGADAVRTLARHHLRHGTTTVLPTTITNPWPDVMNALNAVAEVVRTASEAPASDPLPDVFGAHLEGPFVSPSRLGAQPPFALPPEPGLVREAIATGAVRVVTLAPELDGAAEAARAFARAGARVSFGHTRADVAQVRAVSDAVRAEGGVVGFTHLFNAMGGLGGRVPGVVGAALADSEAYAELILDGHHVAPVAFRAVHAAKPRRLALVTDAMRASGLGEGRSELGGRPVVIEHGAARLEDGTLAGSVATMADLFRAARRAGLSWNDAAHVTSGNAARYLGLTDRGSVRPGARADLVAFDADLELRTVYLAGRPVPGAGPTREGVRT